MADFANAIARAERHAPFLVEQMRRFPSVTDLLAASDYAGALAFDPGGDGFRAAIRRRRGVVALCTAIGDVSGYLDLNAVVAQLSNFADTALDSAIGEAIRLRTPDAGPTGFTAIALGKHGSHELNYSSDIDPILLYDPATLPVSGRDDPGRGGGTNRPQRR